MQLLVDLQCKTRARSHRGEARARFYFLAPKRPVRLRGGVPVSCSAWLSSSFLWPDLLQRLFFAWLSWTCPCVSHPHIIQLHMVKIKSVTLLCIKGSLSHPPGGCWRERGNVATSFECHNTVMCASRREHLWHCVAAEAVSSQCKSVELMCNSPMWHQK